MEENPKPSISPDSDSPEIDLKDPALAVFLAWLLPGLGHWYQGRNAKALLFFVCIMGLFGYGVCLGGGSYVDQDQKTHDLGYGRAVYCSFRPGDWRWHYLLQIGVGLPSMPALVQAARMNHQKEVWFGGFMAPPQIDPPLMSSSPSDPRTIEEERIRHPNKPNINQPSIHELNRHLPRRFELAGFFTMVAGLLNVLAMYDAGAGPVTTVPGGKKEEEETKQ